MGRTDGDPWGRGPRGCNSTERLQEQFDGTDDLFGIDEGWGQRTIRSHWSQQPGEAVTPDITPSQPPTRAAVSSIQLSRDVTAIRPSHGR